jgi:hypothetical protein
VRAAVCLLVADMPMTCTCCACGENMSLLRLQGREDSKDSNKKS